MDWKCCPNCGNASFYWDQEDSASQTMVFLRVGPDGSVLASRPPHDPIREDLAIRILQDEIKCMACAWYGQVAELV